MEVKVLYGLTSVFTDVSNNSVAVTEGKALCYFRNSGKNCAYGRCIICADFVTRCDVYLRNNEAVHGRLGIDVEECVAGIVLVDLA